MKKSVLVLSGLLALSVSGMAAAADPAEQATSMRKAAFLLMVGQMGPVKAMVEGKAPFDKAAFAQRAANLEALSKLPWEYFVPGSEKAKGSESKAEVWSKAAEFKDAADKFQTETAKLAVVAKGGDEAAMKAQFGAVGKSCKACHESFKNR